jgi:hypothetical protein
MLGAQGLWAGRDLYRATPTVTWDLGLYGLIWKTGTYIPHWDSNPRRKDHQIIAPDALTTAPRRRLSKIENEILQQIDVGPLQFLWKKDSLNSSPKQGQKFYQTEPQDSYFTSSDTSKQQTEDSYRYR